MSSTKIVRLDLDAWTEVTSLLMAVKSMSVPWPDGAQRALDAIRDAEEDGAAMAQRNGALFVDGVVAGNAESTTDALARADFGPGARMLSSPLPPIKEGETLNLDDVQRSLWFNTSGREWPVVGETPDGAIGVSAPNMTDAALEQAIAYTMEDLPPGYRIEPVGRDDRADDVEAGGHQIASVLATVDDDAALDDFAAVLRQGQARTEEVERMLAALDPGIRRTVAWLRDNGFATTDSGDGKSKPDLGQADSCSLPYANVGVVIDPSEIVEESHRLVGLLASAGITLSVPTMEQYLPNVEVHYSPLDGIAFLVLAGVDDAMLFGSKQ